MVSTSALFPDPDNARVDDTPDAELVASVRESGVLQSLLIRSLGDGSGDGYAIIAGHRRYRAAVEVGLDEVPCIVMDGLTVDQVAAVQLAENMHRRQLNPIEQAKALDRIRRSTKATQAVIATMTGISQGHVSRLLRLLTLPESVQLKVESGQVSVDSALGLVRAGLGAHRGRGNGTGDPAYDRLHRVITSLGQSVVLKDRSRRRKLAIEAIEILSRWAPGVVPDDREPVGTDDDFDEATIEPGSAPSIRCVYCRSPITVEAPGDAHDRARARRRHYQANEVCRLRAEREARELAGS